MDQRFFAAGTGQDPVVQSQLKRMWASRATRPVSSMFTLEGPDQPLTVLSHVSADTGCFLLHRHDAGDPLYEFISSVDFAADILRHFITDPYEAITVTDDQARIRYLSRSTRNFSIFPEAAPLGADVNEV